MTTKTRVLLIDDDIELSEMLKEYLEQEDFDVVAKHDGESGLHQALSEQYALVVLDVMLPGLKGIDVLNRIRMHSRVPILMLTAKGDDVDRIVGLESGADDYVPKPCTPRELLARIRAILRRTAHSQHSDILDKVIHLAALTVWPEQRKAEWNGQVIDLTSTEFSLLEILAMNAGKVVSKKELSEQGLGRPLARFDRSIDVHLSSIRQKLNQFDNAGSVIVTVRGKGYLYAKNS
ncbi:response regulator transcription factor [Methylocucumis oryzae]|uniref:Chemotaxis protein CheY n=1 Tax=Methylocucumis oryzae TaxID=1632867 RepID=A0A0F3II58_9GAMM|nr:response regulator transcription factor [Methylocucumis oryzae]KJV05139.1 chemotaxis protein CheY [Methylocucumis oryzae]